ncbi:MAG: TATA-box-binding protein [Candidatus Marsarchaeota archaeon]|jgi:transcription initiation factor TFIID TATA-box-binding protein
MEEFSIRIENVVASVSLGGTIDLYQIARAIPGVDYDPKRFPGLLFRLSKPKTATLIFSSGKMVCTGAKSSAGVFEAVDEIVRTLREKGIEIKGQPEVFIQNVVASANLMSEVNLEKAGLQLDNVLYEPEQFSGLIYRMTDPRVVLLIFGSGKMVCTGARSEEDVYKAVEKIYNKLKEIGVLMSKGGANAAQSGS